MTTLADNIKQQAPAIVAKYARRSDARAWLQILNTFVPFFALFYLAVESLKVSYWLTALYVFVMAWFIVRIFMLMHDTGHKSLFHTQALNKLFSFITGLFVGLSGYVWSKHHDYHHATNGNWNKYRGPLSIASVDEFAKLSPAKQRLYVMGRSLWMAPLGAFMYFIFSPRFNWAFGSVKFVAQVAVAKLKRPRTSLKTIIAETPTRYWKDAAEYWHMTGNNIVLLSIWYAGSWYFGAGPFFTVYLSSLILAGSAGLVIFTIQHNYEHAYAADDSNWDYFQAALTGTSFLTLPRIVNWFSADIAYHHIHHLSALIPNYRLESCHKEFGEQFGDLYKLRLRDIPKSFKYILWDNHKHRIISVAEYRQMEAQRAQARARAA